MGYYRNNYQGAYDNSCNERQKHVHEVQGSVKTADDHQHRFCTVSGEAIPYGNHDHVHDVAFRTDTYDDHYHEFKGRTGCAVPVGDGDRHVHYLESVTSVDDGHRHRFECATLVEDPTGEDKGRKCNDKDEKYR